jgi:ABC-type phosphate transport system substrate-binding protein
LFCRRLWSQKVTITGAAPPSSPDLLEVVLGYNKVHSNVEINYQSIGSGGGVKQLTSQTVFFGASDYPLTPNSYKRRRVDSSLSDRPGWSFPP